MIYNFLTLFFLNLVFAKSQQIINHTYLFWSEVDTSRTITIVHHSSLETNTSTLHFWSEEKVKNKNISDSKMKSKVNCHVELKRCIHEFRLSDLTPGQVYEFKIFDKKKELTETKKFKTLPESASELTFIDGGDLSTSETAFKLMEKASAFNPDFVLLGGDIVYDNGEIGNVGLWDTWLSYWEKVMITKDGHMIPIIAAIGNHEVNGGWHKEPKDSTLFLKFFRQEGDQTYFLRKLSSLGILMILDSGHIKTHDSQIPWIKKTLSESKSIPLKMVAYHVPVFPSVRSSSDPWVSEGKKYWPQVFEGNEVNVVFEHHDHALKRTHPIRDNKIHPNGVIYIGDGCMGKSPRDVKKEWYLAQAKSIEHFWVGTITKGELNLKAIGINGEIFDEVRIKTKTR